MSSLKDIFEKKNFVIDALTLIDLQALKKGQIFLSPPLINDCLLKMIRLPDFIQSLVVGFDTNSVVLDVKVPILHKVRIYLELIAFTWDKSGHYAGFSYGGRNNPLATKALLALIEKIMALKSHKASFLKVDTVAQEIWLTADNVPQIETLLNTSFEEGLLKDLLVIRLLSLSYGGLALEADLRV